MHTAISSSFWFRLKGMLCVHIHNGVLLDNDIIDFREFAFARMSAFELELEPELKLEGLVLNGW